MISVVGLCQFVFFCPWLTNSALWGELARGRFGGRVSQGRFHNLPPEQSLKICFINSHGSCHCCFPSNGQEAMSGDRIMDQKRMRLDLWIHHYLKEFPGRRALGAWARGLPCKGSVRGELHKLTLATFGSSLHFEDLCICASPWFCGQSSVFTRFENLRSTSDSLVLQGVCWMLVFVSVDLQARGRDAILRWMTQRGGIRDFH